MWLYTDLLQALNGEALSSAISTDETLISASTAPHCVDMLTDTHAYTHTHTTHTHSLSTYYGTHTRTHTLSLSPPPFSLLSMVHTHTHTHKKTSGPRTDLKTGVAKDPRTGLVRQQLAVHQLLQTDGASLPLVHQP